MRKTICVTFAALALFVAFATSALAACTQITSLPFIAATPGTYCLQQGLVAADAGDAITINANNVTIDGEGHTITGPLAPATAARGVLAINRSGLVIQNLRFIGFQTAIVVGETDAFVAGTRVFSDTRMSRDVTVRNVSVDNPTFQGIHIRADGVVVEGVKIAGVGPSTAYPYAFATALHIQGNSCAVRDNLITLGEASGSGENVGIAIYYGAGCTIERNSIFFDRAGPYSRNFGIWVRPDGGGMPVVSQNRISGADYAAGPFGIYQGNVFVGTHCAPFARRISVRGEGFADVGDNVEVGAPPGLLQQGGRSESCLDDPTEAETRFRANPSGLTGYAVMLALGEAFEEYDRTEAVAWMMVAAHFGHAVAAGYLAGLADAPAIINAAAARRDEILGSL